MLVAIESLERLPTRISLEMLEMLHLLDKFANLVWRKQVRIERERLWDEEVEVAIANGLREIEAEYERAKRCAKRG